MYYTDGDDIILLGLYEDYEACAGWSAVLCLCTCLTNNFVSGSVLCGYNEIMSVL